MAFGLPISVAIGWTLATPTRKPASVGAAHGTGGRGAGGIGAAPERTDRQPATTVQYSSRPARPGISPALPTSSGAPSPVVSGTPSGPTPDPSAASSVPTLPPLTLPPVPTPTEITSTPTASATPTAEDPSGSPPAP